MASSYITTAQKDQIESAFDNIHETFGRTITVISNPKMTVISSSSTFNSFYNRDKPTSPQNVEYTENKQTFKARIKYVNNSVIEAATSNSQYRLVLPSGTVKIKVGQDGYAALKEAKKVEFDGRRYSIMSDHKAYGAFGPKYYSFLLSPINE